MRGDKFNQRDDAHRTHLGALYVLKADVRIWCEGCGRSEREFALGFQQRRKLPMELTIYDIAQRLVCSRCGSRNVGIEYIL
jgi:hypothetical protein